MPDSTAYTKKTSVRDMLQQGIYKIINPFVRFLIRIGLTPNAVTTIGLLLNIGVAVIFVIGAEEGNRGDLSYVGWAGALILFAGLFDMLDGQVARLGNMSSRFGALYDSVLDRYSELIMFLGICYYLVAHHYFMSSILAFVALIGSMMVSYTRARAEGLGIECKGGLMQRPERVVLVGLAAMASGITGHYVGGDHKWYIPGISFHIFETISIFTLPIAVLAVLANITAVIRLREAKRSLEAKEASEAAKPRKSAFSGMESIIGILMYLTFSFIASPAECNSVLPAEAAKKTAVEEQDTFPVPRGIKNQMFYVQRTPNTNTIIYALNMQEDGKLDEDEPIHIFWIRYTEGGEHKDLNYIQRKFAYGLKVDRINSDQYKLRFVAYDKHPLYLMKATNGKFYVYTTIQNRQSVLSRIYIKIDGGSFWYPNVLYVELKGIDVQTGKTIVERFKP